MGSRADDGGLVKSAVLVSVRKYLLPCAVASAISLVSAIMCIYGLDERGQAKTSAVGPPSHAHVAASSEATDEEEGEGSSSCSSTSCCCSR